MSSKLSIYKVKDKAESYYTKKDVIFDLPMRLLIVGKSQFSGKSNLLVNLLCRDEYYNKDFAGEDIFLISPSIYSDAKLEKLVKVKNIPEENLMESYDEESIVALYDLLEQEYEENVADHVKPTNKLIVFDDMSFSGVFKKRINGIISKIYSNGRHINLSVISTSQKYSDLSTSSRENCSGAVFFNCSNKQLELIEADHNILLNGKKAFMIMFREALEEPHSFLVVNYSNNKESRYLDKHFNPISLNK
jgi:hypothetical protein